MITFIICIILVVFALAVGVWSFAAGGMPFSRGCNPPLPRQAITVGRTSFDVEMATTMAEQSCGLSGRAELNDGQGMLFAFRSAGIQNFWMKDMNFPIDIIWISGGRVAGFSENADPQVGAPLWKLKIYASPPGVDTVLEVPAGTVARRGIAIGDAIGGL